MDEKKYLTPAEIYLASCAPKPLPENFGDSLIRHIFKMEAGHEVHDRSVDNWFSPAWGVALRGAIGEATSWIGTSGYVPEDPKKDDESYETKMRTNMYFMAQQHQQRYCANELLRRMGQNLCRDAVPLDERTL